MLLYSLIEYIINNAIRKGQVERVKELIRRGKNISWGLWLLVHSSSNFSEELFDFFLEINPKTGRNYSDITENVIIKLFRRDKPEYVFKALNAVYDPASLVTEEVYIAAFTSVDLEVEDFIDLIEFTSADVLAEVPAIAIVHSNKFITLVIINSVIATNVRIAASAISAAMYRGLFDIANVLINSGNADIPDNIIALSAKTGSIGHVTRFVEEGHDFSEWDVACGARSTIW